MLFSFNPSHFMEASRSWATYSNACCTEIVSIHLILWKHHEVIQIIILPNENFWVSIHLILWKHHEAICKLFKYFSVVCFNPSHFMEASRRKYLFMKMNTAICFNPSHFMEASRRTLGSFISAQKLRFQSISFYGSITK